MAIIYSGTPVLIMLHTMAYNLLHAKHELAFLRFRALNVIYINVKSSHVPPLWSMIKFEQSQFSKLLNLKLLGFQNSLHVFRYSRLTHVPFGNVA